MSDTRKLRDEDIQAVEATIEAAMAAMPDLLNRMIHNCTAQCLMNDEVHIATLDLMLGLTTWLHSEQAKNTQAISDLTAAVDALKEDNLRLKQLIPSL